MDPERTRSHERVISVGRRSAPRLTSVGAYPRFREGARDGADPSKPAGQPSGFAPREGAAGWLRRGGCVVLAGTSPAGDCAGRNVAVSPARRPPFFATISSPGPTGNVKDRESTESNPRKKLNQRRDRAGVFIDEIMTETRGQNRRCPPAEW